MFSQSFHNKNVFNEHKTGRLDQTHLSHSAYTQGLYFSLLVEAKLI